MRFTTADIRNTADGWLNALLRFAPKFVTDVVDQHRSIALLAMLSSIICFLTVSTLLVLKFASAPAYTATTFIQPYMLRKEAAKDSGQAPLDDKMVIDGTLQLIESQVLSRKVAEKLKSDPKPSDWWFLAPVSRNPASSTPEERSRALDLAARAISQQLSVSNQRKSHLIEVSYTAKSPSEAALITNAIASEYIVFHRTAETAKAYGRAQRQHQELSARYGIQHPRVIAAKQDLETAHAEIQIAEDASTLLTSQELMATGLVIPAAAISIPSNRSLGPTIGAGLILGMLLSVALCLILEPGAWTAILRFVR